jgi:hypothetical protein
MAENQHSPTSFVACLPYLISTKSVTLYGINRKVHSWTYITWALLWLNMAENKNCLTTFH